MKRHHPKFPLVLLVGLHAGVAAAQVATGCMAAQVEAMHQAVAPWVKSPPQGDVDPILALACKPWPAQPDLFITSVIFEPKAPPPRGVSDADDGPKGWATLVGDRRSNRVLAKHRAQIEVDAAVRIHASSLVIDTAAYRLAPGTVAFGIRKNIGHSPNCADGGSNELLTLFVYASGKLRPVLSEPDLTFWSIDTESGHHPCGPQPADYLLAQGSTVLRLLDTTSNGFRDIELVTRVATSWEKADDRAALYPIHQAQMRVRYDGTRYAISRWIEHTQATLDQALKAAAAEKARRSAKSAPPQPHAAGHR